VTTASLTRELSTTPAHLMTALSLANARVAHGLTAYPYSMQTGGYTLDQLDGENCGACGGQFRAGGVDHPVFHEQVAEWRVYRHVMCPKAGASQ